LCPSFGLAHAELCRDGLNLDIKAVRRIARQCGDELLKLRTTQLELGTMARRHAVFHE
jgi:hypothetical protein